MVKIVPDYFTNFKKNKNYQSYSKKDQKDSYFNNEDGRKNFENDIHMNFLKQVIFYTCNKK
jgi:hypothetical protein